MTIITRRQFVRGLAGSALAAGIGPNPSFLAAQASSWPAGDGATRPGRPGRSFCFLHTYEATGRYWKGIAKAGLIRRTTGVRLVNTPFSDDDNRRFNAVARIGGELHGIIQERRCPFIIDRVAGGAPHRVYEYDQKLIADYASLLGQKFLGGQVHETVCNVHNDWDRLVKADKRFATEPIQPEAVRKYFTWASSERWLEYGTLDDYAGRSYPKDDRGWWKDIEAAARRQAARFGSHFSYAEGSHWGQLVWHIFYKWGATSGLAEVGVWASTQSQFAIASLRGAAKAAGKNWGVFFAPWGPGGCTSFISEKDWSWQCSNTSMINSKWPVGPELGASSALQRRIFFHAYLSGAHTLHEEWGAEGNLLDWDAGKLSSYGLVTRDLLDFQEAFPDVGEPYTPIALVLDASIPPPTAEPWDKLVKGLFQYAPADKANAARKGAGENEVACYAPCAIPEIFDVVPSDAPEQVWSQYKEVIKVGSGDAPARAKAYPAEELIDRIIAAARELSPFTRLTHMPMQINRRASDGAWIVALYNPWGAKRGDVYNVGSVLDEGCAMGDVLRAKFAVKSARAIHAWPSASAVTVRGDELAVNVGPGGTLILEVLPR